jgi:hypothetical protein
VTILVLPVTLTVTDVVLVLVSESMLHLASAQMVTMKTNLVLVTPVAQLV